MSLFLVSSVLDDGISTNHLRLVEAESELAVAQSMLDFPDAWVDLFGYARPIIWSHGHYGVQQGSERPLHFLIRQPDMTAERLLVLIARTHVDGDSESQVRITPLKVEPLPHQAV